MSKQFLFDRLLGNDQNHHKQMEGDTCLERVPEWGVADVVNWLRNVGFTNFVNNFEEVGVDGDILLLLKEKDIKEDLDMRNGIVRKRFLRELRKLKRNCDYSCCNGTDTADFLSKVGDDFREYTYNLVSKDMSVDYMRKLGAADLQDMLKDVGIDNLVHQHRIVEAVLCDDEMFQCSDSSSHSSETTYDVYLTYPGSDGAELASLIRMQLEMRGISVHLTSPNSLNCLNKQALKLIQETKHFVLVLPPGGLDDCLQKAANSTAGGTCKLQAEIIAALGADVNIVPVTDNFQWPETEELHEDVRAICYFNSVRWVHDYQDACLNKIERFIRGDSMLKVDSPFSTLSGRSPMPKSPRRSGLSTPSGVPRRLSSPLLTNMLTVPRHLRNSSHSLVSNDSGV